jgi:PGDYG protein
MPPTEHIPPVLERLSFRRATYRTRPVEVNVEFSTHEQIIDTLEGPVVCHIGDAIVTGVKGERHPQPVDKFDSKYEPIQGQQSHSNGRFTKRITSVQAAQLHEPLDIELSNGRGALHGRSGDWCIWYDAADLSIVARDIFPELYESNSISIYVELGGDLSAEDKYSALQVVHLLDVALRQSTIIFSEESPNLTSANPIWFRIVKSAISETKIIPSLIEIPIGTFISSDPKSGVMQQLKNAISGETAFGFSVRKLLRILIPRGVVDWLRKLLIPGRAKDRQDSVGQIICSQLAAVDDLNVALVARWDGNFPFFVEERNALSEPLGLKKAWRIGAIADNLAGEYQDKWQGLVFATTKQIAAQSMWKRLLSVPHTLVTLGLLAAVMLAAFSELGGNCDRNDPWSFELCTSSAWAHWAGPSFFLVYLLALGLAWLRYAHAKTQQWEIRHQDYRLLAESVRVLHVRTVLGKSSCVARDLPLAEPTNSGWVRLALRSVYFDVHKAGLQTSEEEPEQVERALATFVNDQMKYHEKILLERRKKAIDRLTIASHLGFLLFIFILIVVIANVAREALLQHAFLSSMMAHIAFILLVLGLGSWGGLRKVLDTFALEQEVQRGNLVMSYLATADKLGTRDAILESANYFLEDQAHWHALHRSKPIEAATGG